MHKAKIATLSTANSPESPKKVKIVLQTPKHKHTSSLITPKASALKFNPSNTLASKTKLSISKYISPSAATIKMTPKHKHAFSEQLHVTISTVKNSKMIKRHSNASPERKMIWKNVALPASIELVTKMFHASLSMFEQTEILSFPQIYYIAEGVSKIKTLSINNFGFDDEKGDYRIIVGDHINYRYEIRSILGKGSFGQVVKVYDHKEKKDMAIKIIKNKPRFHQQALEEVEILKYLRDKDPNDVYCVVHAQENFLFRRHMVMSK
jgi:hypothetical protein